LHYAGCSVSTRCSVDLSTFPSSAFRSAHVMDAEVNFYRNQIYPTQRISHTSLSRRSRVRPLLSEFSILSSETLPENRSLVLRQDIFKSQKPIKYQLSATILLSSIYCSGHASSYLKYFRPVLFMGVIPRFVVKSVIHNSFYIRSYEHAST